MNARIRLYQKLFLNIATLIISNITSAQQLMTNGQPAELDIRPAGAHSIRITLKPTSFIKNFPYTPALAERVYAKPVIAIRTVTGKIKKQVGSLWVEVQADPLRVIVTNAKGELIQNLIFEKDGRLNFKIGDAPILGMGEGGPTPGKGDEWKNKAIEFDRRGRMFEMQPRWQSDAYGTRNPVPMLIGTDGWALFAAAPWVKVDLRDKNTGIFIPWKPMKKDSIPQNERTQGQNNGKGLPPVSAIVPGLYDLFVFDAHDPAQLMKDISVITGPAVMPPKWAMGYMQSHRTLVDEQQMMGIVDTFRAKKIPVDAVIYLGTGFVSRGWNTKQPSFEANPAVFKRPIENFIADMHTRNVKVVLHMVPYDRDKLPDLHGSIPVKKGEVVNNGHIYTYWQDHVGLMNKGVDAFWPDEGDWFDLFERIKRHQLYYEGPLSTKPNVRPWSLHRNGFLGIAQWGGWVWSGDTESSWKTLEGQIAVGINHSLSLSPYWGSDIGGFYSTAETTGELYTRWYQFAAFVPSFRSHGRTWFTRLPWGWGLKDIGPRESGAFPLLSEINNPTFEPIVKKYDELRYQLLSYNYTLTWQARATGMPLMRAMWLQYPQDKTTFNLSTQYMWGSQLLIAPVFKKGATSREVYLPAGQWYDFWTNEKSQGGQTVTKQVDLNTMPIYVKAGSIIPFDPIRQYTAEVIKEPLTIKVYKGANGAYTLYEDDGISLDYQKGKFRLTKMTWDDKGKKLRIEPGNVSNTKGKRQFKIELLPGNVTKTVMYNGLATEVSL